MGFQRDNSAALSSSCSQGLNSHQQACKVSTLSGGFFFLPQLKLRAVHGSSSFWIDPMPNPLVIWTPGPTTRKVVGERVQPRCWSCCSLCFQCFLQNRKVFYLEVSRNFHGLARWMFFWTSFLCFWWSLFSEDFQLAVAGMGSAKVAISCRTSCGWWRHLAASWLRPAQLRETDKLLKRSSSEKELTESLKT